MKSPNSEKLLKFFQCLDSPATDHREVSYVVESAFKIAVYHLRLIHNRIVQILLRDEFTIEDLALDCVANLFKRDDTGRFVLLHRAFSDWDPPVSSPTEAMFFFQKVTVGAVEQHVSALLREADPVFSKILDHVNYMIRRDGFKKLTYCGAVYIVEKNTVEITYTPAGYDEINNIPGSLFKANKKLIARVLSHISAETQLFPAIHLNALVARIKNMNIASFTVKAATDSFTSSFEVDEIILRLMSQLEEKLYLTYFNTGKLNYRESQAFLSALQNIADDMRDGGINPGLYIYLKDYFPGLSKEDYQNRYHNILEYLVKTMKSTLSEQLKNKR